MTPLIEATEIVVQAGARRILDGVSLSLRGGETVVVHAVGRYRLIIPWVTGRTIPIEATAEVRREGFRRGP